MAGPLRATLFLTRQNGDMIPLVAVDELPYRIAIDGAPRLLTALDLAGMTCVGNLEHRHGHYLLDRSYCPPISRLSQSSSQILKPKFFGTRNTGALIPLIAMDEMPESFVLEGVPRVASVMDITGMTCIGTHDTRGRFHTFTDVNEWAKSNEPAQPTILESPMIVSPMRTLSVVSSDRSSASLAPPPAPCPTLEEPFKQKVVKVVGKKYCSYWLRNGECDYMQQGCMYKHEMPLDIETLQSLGLRDIPRWYRDQHGLGSYLAAGGSGASFGGPDLKSTVVVGGKENGKKTKLMQNWRPEAVRGRAPGRTADNRRANNNNDKSQPGKGGVKPVHEKMSSIHLPLQRIKPMGRQNVTVKVPNDKASRNLQAVETMKTLDTIEQAKAVSTYLRPGLPQLGGKVTVEESEFSSANRTGPPILTPETGSSPESSTATVRFPDIPRRPSMTSMVSDVEATIFRADAARRAQDKIHYDRIMANLDRQAAVDKAKREMEEKSAGNQTGTTKGRRGSSSSSTGMRGGRGRGGGRRQPRRGASKD